MCGIAGQVSFSGMRADEDLLATMSERIRHRGPDGEGMHLDGPVGLAHRRLSIIDLSDAARQPMTNEDGSLVLVYNGEIYNYRELREELRRKGHTFRSNADSEVILHAYEEWGRECLSRFNGMWAFALWDSRGQELFCARDRFGIKPFYYAVAEGSFFFASEIKALLCHPAIGRRPDEGNLLTFLAWGVLDHGAGTMVEGVSQIPPAHALVVKTTGMEAPYRFWDFSVTPAISPANGGQASREFLSLLRDAVRIHLRSDVPVGTCLSGGIDSSTLAVLINGLIREEGPGSVGERQKTFSAVFPGERYDESRYIAEVVAATGVDARSTTPEAPELLRDLSHLLSMQDEPFSSLSIYAQYRVMRLAAGEVKVVLDGQGADELLGGYLAYQGTYLRTLAGMGRILTFLREGMGSLRYHGEFFREVPGQILARRARRGLLSRRAPAISRYGGTLPDVLKREIQSTNLPALLHWEDRNSMAFSIESRVPYLDVRVVEFLAALPLGQKIRNGMTKHVLREATRGVIPEAIRSRRDKMGFVTPEEVWMGRELADHVLAVFGRDSFRKRPYWDAGKVVENYHRFLSGRAPYSGELFRIACTELWLGQVFDRGG